MLHHIQPHLEVDLVAQTVDKCFPTPFCPGSRAGTGKQLYEKSDLWTPARSHFPLRKRWLLMRNISVPDRCQRGSALRMIQWFPLRDTSARCIIPLWLLTTLFCFFFVFSVRHNRWINHPAKASTPKEVPNALTFVRNLRARREQIIAGSLSAYAAPSCVPCVKMMKGRCLLVFGKWRYAVLSPRKQKPTWSHTHKTQNTKKNETKPGEVLTPGTMKQSALISTHFHVRPFVWAFSGRWESSLSLPRRAAIVIRFDRIIRCIRRIAWDLQKWFPKNKKTQQPPLQNKTLQDTTRLISWEALIINLFRCKCWCFPTVPAGHRVAAL